MTFDKGVNKVCGLIKMNNASVVSIKLVKMVLFFKKVCKAD